MGAASRRINLMHLIRERVAVYIAVMVALAIVVMRRTIIPYLVVPIRTIRTRQPGLGSQLSVVTDGTPEKRSAVLNFYPYRTRISSHNLPLATICIEYAAHMPIIYTYITIRYLY